MKSTSSKQETCCVQASPYFSISVDKRDGPGLIVPVIRVNEPTLPDHCKHHLKQLAESIVRHIPNNHEGFTYDPWNRCLFTTSDPEIFAVSLRSHEQIFSSVPSVTEVKTWLIQHHDAWRHNGHFIGFWPNDVNRMYYLDVSIIVRGQAIAKQIGEREEQISIHHFISGEDIPVPLVAEREAA